MHSSLPNVFLSGSPVNLVLVALFLNVLIKSIYLIGSRPGFWSENDKPHTYIGADYPERWPIDVGHVLLDVTNTVRYNMSTPDGAEEWKKLVPGDGLIYLGPEKRPFTISMLHQLRCLDIVRQGVIRTEDYSEESWGLVRHCMNYIRQMVLCRADSYLESFQDASNTRPLDTLALFECRDWDAVYQEVKNNHLSYSSWLESVGTVSP